MEYHYLRQRVEGKVLVHQKDGYLVPLTNHDLDPEKYHSLSRKELNTRFDMIKPCQIILTEYSISTVISIKQNYWLKGFNQFRWFLIWT